MKKNLIAAIVLLLFMTLIGNSYAAPTPPIKADTPLPKQVNIVAPGPGVLPEVAAFFGTWVGTWEWDYYTDGVHVKRDAVIIVEKIEGNNIHMVFSWGNLRPYYRNSTVGWTRVVGTYQPATGKVYVPLKEPMVFNPNTATLWLSPDGKMQGYRNKYLAEASDYKAVYTKQQ